VDLVRKLLDNLNNEKRERNIREIAKMLSDSNKKANFAKLANMVSSNIEADRAGFLWRRSVEEE
jgi:hypothetical protein